MAAMDNIYTVIITAITVLGSATAFRFYEKKSMRKERDEEFIRHDCKDRISKLEALLVESAREKDELRKMVLELTREVASLRTKVEFFEKGNTSVVTSKPKISRK
jgi:predicted RNase H-like nuclease (RuvC/YqgF family)